MHSKFILLFSFWTVLIQAQIHHDLSVEIKPTNSKISVIDEISFDSKNQPMFFTLNADFKPKMLSKGFKLKAVNKKMSASDIGMDRIGDETNSDLKITKWKVICKKKKWIGKPFKISYSGLVADAIEKNEKDYQRGFSESPGIISETGIYLAGSTYWVPIFENEMMTFSMKVQLPNHWKSVAQGKRTTNVDEGNHHIDIWNCDKPQEEVFLIGAKFSEYSFDAGNVKAMAFLRTPDEGLANKYLETTAQYLEMYRSILGVYPYSKFALVENFWETGYGMPSFTLLGEKIIRFPFILHSSYPHELLHNWWGNSVYVDFEKGNWCEGLTAYMADHLIKEQRGRGMNYRRSTLQKFSDLVDEKTDFPITDFRSRYDGPSEAIGYGKTLMMFHMLRRKFGDDAFLLALGRFYRKNKFKRASFDDLKNAFETVSKGEDLKPFFDQWITRKGAPQLVLDSVEVKEASHGRYNSTIRLKQIQKEKVFNLDVPVSIVTKSETKTRIFPMTEKDQVFNTITEEKPLKIVIDPMFDIFRILDPKEVSPALTKAYGSDKTLIVVPFGTKKGSTYDVFANQWVKSDPTKFEIINDHAPIQYPKDATIWILGYENRLIDFVNKGIEVYGAKMTQDSVIFPDKPVLKKGNDVIITLTHPKDEKAAVVFIAIGNDDAIPGLVRKLPHYGKYSYLAFEGTDPTNIAKGQWPVIQSPLIKDLVDDVPPLKVEKREALAYLEPVFSVKNMMKDIEYLASKEMKGRGLGTPELDVAANYIAESFKNSGLKPWKDSYFQKWTADVLDKKNVKLTNVVAMIPGVKPELNNQPVVISAHYDHLGMGWPDAHAGDKGKIHHGADDNASGVAVMLELAKRIAKTAKPNRPIIFVAFTGEEAGLVGSKYFVNSLKNQAFANINLDTEGSLFDQKIIILNANTASEWKHIFMGTDYVTGIGTHLVMKPLDASDQGAFIEKGIPAVQFFAGATTNYHRPSDTPDKIDAAGLVKVATVAKEVLLYLGDRERPMKFIGEIAKKEDHKAHHPNHIPERKRSASTGAVPSFSYEGNGVQLGDVPAGTPAEKAGLKTGDIIVEMNGVAVEDLRGYSQLLKKLLPGQTVKVKVLRDGKEILTDLVLKSR